MIDFGNNSQRLILSIIHKNSPITRASIAQRSGLTPAAITKITKKLIDDGFTKVVGKQKSSRGQPGIELSINSEAAYSLGINIELEKISIELVNFIGESVYSQAIRGIFDTPNIAINELISLLQVTSIAFSEEFEKLIGIGITTSCNFIRDSNNITMPPHLKKWEEIEITKILGQKYACPCWLENDGIAATLGESLRSRINRNNNFFYLYLGYGIGGGHYYNGQVYHGSVGNAGRIGKLFPDRKNRPSLACLYDHLGMYEASPHREEVLSTLVNKHPEKVSKWKENAQNQLLSALQAIRAICDPNEIIVGGLLPPSLIEELVFAAKEQLKLYLEKEEAMPTIIPAALSGDKMAATGAAILPLYRLVYSSEKSNE